MGRVLHWPKIARKANGVEALSARARQGMVGDAPSLAPASSRGRCAGGSAQSGSVPGDVAILPVPLDACNFLRFRTR